MDRADESRGAKRRRASPDTVLRRCLDCSDDEDLPTPSYEEWLGERAFGIYRAWRVGKGRPVWHAAAVTIQRCFRRFRAREEAELDAWRKGVEKKRCVDEWGTMSEDDGLQYQYEEWCDAGEPLDERRWYVHHGRKFKFYRNHYRAYLTENYCKEKPEKP